MSSIVATRQALKAAVDAVDGITGYVYAPTVYKQGDSWAQWAGGEPPEDGRYRNNYVNTYRVLVVLPVDAQRADVFVDDHLDDLIDAIAPVLTVSGFAYVSLPTEGSQAAYKALVITGETE